MFVSNYMIGTIMSNGRIKYSILALTKQKFGTHITAILFGMIENLGKPSMKTHNKRCLS